MMDNEIFLEECKTPFDLENLLNEIVELDDLLNDTSGYYFYTKKLGDVDNKCIDLRVNDKRVVSFFDDEGWAIDDGINYCDTEQLMLIVQFLYLSDPHQWFKGDKKDEI